MGPNGGMKHGPGAPGSMGKEKITKGIKIVIQMFIQLINVNVNHF